MLTVEEFSALPLLPQQESQFVVSVKLLFIYSPKVEIFVFIISHSIFTARRAPFTVGVNFDSNELTDDQVANAMATLIEMGEGPGGIVGFKLIYYQVAC